MTTFYKVRSFVSFFFFVDGRGDGWHGRQRCTTCAQRWKELNGSGAAWGGLGKEKRMLQWEERTMLWRKEGRKELFPGKPHARNLEPCSEEANGWAQKEQHYMLNMSSSSSSRSSKDLMPLSREIFQIPHPSKLGDQTQLAQDSKKFTQKAQQFTAFMRSLQLTPSAEPSPYSILRTLDARMHLSISQSQTTPSPLLSALEKPTGLFVDLSMIHTHTNTKRERERERKRERSTPLYRSPSSHQPS